MYQNINTCIRKRNEYSEFFNCEIGVKQGGNLFLYLNDLEKSFGENNMNGLIYICEMSRTTRFLYQDVHYIVCR